MPNVSRALAGVQKYAGGGAGMAGGAPADLVQDPTSGLWYSPTTQNFYTKDANGAFTVQRDPNVSSAVASFYGAAGKSNAESQPYEQDYRNVFGEQSGLAGDLQNTIHNVNAPSVAHEQLAQALQGNEATQLAGASGVGGENAFMARRNASNNIAALNAGAGQSAALLRAQEVAGAQQQLGGVLGQQSAESSGMYGAKTGLGLDYSRLAAATKAQDLGNQTSQRGQNIDLAKGITTAGGSAASAAITASDPALKHDIHEESPEAIHKFLDALQPDGFRYNDDGPDDPERHGVMTTDLKKSDIGRSLVRETPEGEGYDQGQALGALFSALADMHRRVKRVEGSRG